MELSGRTKVVIALSALAGAVLFLIVVDLGVAAGRIHAGVEVDGVDVGGESVPDAVALLTEEGKELKRKPLVFQGPPGVECERRSPAVLGWGPQPSDTARKAYSVGREDAPFGALRDRARAWVGGVDVGWADSPDEAKVAAFIADCETVARAGGYEVDTDALREQIERAIVTPDRQIYDLPLVEDSAG